MIFERMSPPIYIKVRLFISSNATVIEFISAERSKDFKLEETKIFQITFILNVNMNLI